MDTRDRLERLRQLDVDVDALLEAAVALAEDRRDIRTKATEAPLPPHDPAILSRKIFVPAVEEEEADPVALLEKALAMVRLDRRPALALHIALAAPGGPGGPLATVQADPRNLFGPEVAAHVSDLLRIARRPGPADWVKTSDGGTWPLVDERFLPLPSRFDAEVETIARQFLSDFAEPSTVVFGIAERRLLAMAPPPAPPTPVDPEDVPLGQMPPPPETPSERQAAEEKAKERLAEWWEHARAFQAETYLVIRHAAQRAVERLFHAASQRPSDVLGTWSVGIVAEKLEPMPNGGIAQFLAEVLKVDPKTIRRALKKFEKYRLPIGRHGHSRATQCPRNTRETPSTIRPPDAARAGRKRETHDAQGQPQPPETSREAVQLPARRPARAQRVQREPVADPHRPSGGPRRQARKDDPRPSG